jgi:hypothetical protein
VRVSREHDMRDGRHVLEGLGEGLALRIAFVREAGVDDVFSVYAVFVIVCIVIALTRVNHVLMEILGIGLGRERT